MQEEIIKDVVRDYLLDLGRIELHSTFAQCEILLAANDLGVNSPRLSEAVDRLAREEPPPGTDEDLLPAITRQLVFTKFDTHRESRNRFIKYWIEEQRFRGRDLLTVSFLVDLALENLSVLSEPTAAYARTWYYRHSGLHAQRAVSWSIYHLARLGDAATARDRADAFLRERNANHSWDGDVRKTLACLYPLLLSGVVETSDVDGSLDYVMGHAHRGLSESGTGRAALVKTLHRAQRFDALSLAALRDQIRSAGTVFLSHSNRDKPFIRRLADDLRRNGVGVWLDEAEILAGDSLVDKIESGIEGMQYLAIALSAHSTKSDWVRQEINMAFVQALEERRVKLIPLLIEDCEVPLRLRQYRYADFRSNYDEGFQVLLRAIREPHPSVATPIQK